MPTRNSVTRTLPLNASPAATRAAAASPEYRLRVAAAYHPATTAETRKTLTMDAHAKVREAAANAALYDTRDLRIAYAWVTKLAS